MPLTPAIAVQATRLGAGFHGDPADGIIVATALVEAAPLVTKYQKILDFTGVETIWDLRLRALAGGREPLPTGTAPPRTRASASGRWRAPRRSR